MPPERQQEIAAIATEAGLSGARTTLAQATAFLTRYLDTSPDWSRVPRGKHLWVHRTGQKRWRIKTRVLEVERQGTDGTWHKIQSAPLIDLALRLSGLGGEEAREQATSALGHRRSEQAARHQEAADKRREDGIALLATKALDALDPSVFRNQVLRGKATDDARVAGMLGLERERLARELGDKPLPVRDEWVTSVDQPPWLPFLREVNYRWVQPVGDSAAAVHLEGREGRVHVHLMSLRQPDYIVNPLTMAFTVGTAFWKPEEIPVPHGYISGVVQVIRGEPVAQLTYIQAATKGRGSGRWMVRLWCRLLKGWGIQKFIVFRPRSEGRPFFERLVEKDELALLGGDGDSMLVACRPGRTASLPFTTGGPGDHDREVTSSDLDQIATDVARTIFQLVGEVRTRLQDLGAVPLNDQFLETILTPVFSDIFGPDFPEPISPVWGTEVREWLGREAARRSNYSPDWTEFPEAVSVYRLVTSRSSAAELTGGRSSDHALQKFGITPARFARWYEQGSRTVAELATDAANLVADVLRNRETVRTGSTEEDQPLGLESFRLVIRTYVAQLHARLSGDTWIDTWVGVGRMIQSAVMKWARSRGLDPHTRPLVNAMARTLARPSTKEPGMTWRLGMSPLAIAQAAWLYEVGNYGEFDEGRQLIADADDALPKY